MPTGGQLVEVRTVAPLDVLVLAKAREVARPPPPKVTGGLAKCNDMNSYQMA